MCSGVFLSGRDPASVLNEDLAHDTPLASLIGIEVDAEHRVVTVSWAGLVQRRALFREGLGCTLLSGVTEEQLRAQPAINRTPAFPNPADIPWPAGDLVAGAEAPEGIDRQEVAAALDRAFAEPDRTRLRRTRAVAVVHDGRIIAERYAPGFSKHTPLTGWSMTKSVTNALVGILVGQGKLSLEAPAPVPEWAGADDPRRLITLDQLMRMSSGLAFDETYSDLTADVSIMLFRSPSAGAYAAARPLAHAPDSEWYYSSGTTNIISRIIRDAVGGPLSDYWAFPRREMFDRLGARSATVEPDPSGNFVGSSFMYASARDWARLGLLYLRDGVWEGERILPEGWVSYSTTPAPKAPQGCYGAQIWLNAGEPDNPAKRRWPDVPADAFYFSGFEGQSVVVIPSRNVVIVRLGLTHQPASWNLSAFLADILEAIP